MIVATDHGCRRQQEQRFDQRYWVVGLLCWLRPGNRQNIFHQMKCRRILQIMIIVFASVCNANVHALTLAVAFACIPTAFCFESFRECAPRVSQEVLINIIRPSVSPPTRRSNFRNGFEKVRQGGPKWHLDGFVLGKACWVFRNLERVRVASFGGCLLS